MPETTGIEYCRGGFGKDDPLDHPAVRIGIVKGDSVAARGIEQYEYNPTDDVRPEMIAEEQEFGFDYADLTLRTKRTRLARTRPRRRRLWIESGTKSGEFGRSSTPIREDAPNQITTVFPFLIL